MDENEAREVAAAWHGGQWSPLYAFVSTGHIVDGVLREIDECIAEARAASLHWDATDLLALRRYLMEHAADN